MYFMPMYYHFDAVLYRVPAVDVKAWQLSYSADITNGMVYLSNKGFVHRDLAARNILVTAGRNCKVDSYNHDSIIVCYFAAL